MGIGTYLALCEPWKSSRPNKVAGLLDDPWIQDSRSYQWAKFGLWTSWANLSEIHN